MWWISGVSLVLLLLLLLILYLRGTFRKKVKYRIEDVPSVEEPHFLLAMMGVSASFITNGYPTDFWFDIDAIYTARLKAIKSAQRTIHFETFYMTPGHRANEFAAALTERSQARVEVLLLVDSFGVLSMPKEYWKQLQEAGVNVRFFHSFSWRNPLTYNIRTHRKLMLIDGEIAFVGGMGVSDHWDGMKETGDTAPWLDFEARFTGPIVVILEGIFMQHWLYVGGVTRLHSEIFNPALSGGSTVLVTPRNAPGSRSSVYALFYTSVLAAKQRIWLASPYFLPDRNTRNALLLAKKNGVDVRILTAGPHNDKKLVYYAVRERYPDLLNAGIEIYEYHPSMMHAKVLLIDNTFVSTGSTNFDPRSFFHNDELHLSLAEAKLAQFVEHFFLSAFAKSRRIDRVKWQARPLLQRVLGRLALVVRWQL
jgi:cardiolipin synthase